MHFTLLIACLLVGQPQNTPSRWAPFTPLVGEWTGKSTGQSGVGTAERSYQMVMNNQYLHIKTKVVFPPREGKKNGEVHEDWGMFSFNKVRNKFLLREFHVEGFVNQYVMSEPDQTSKKLVFVTESIDNIPAGFRAKLVIDCSSKDELREEFSIAEPGKDFEVYSTSVLQRKQPQKSARMSLRR